MAASLRLLLRPRPRVIAGSSRLVHALIAVSVGLAGSAGIWWQTSPTYYRLTREGRTAEGVVTATEPENHRIIRYRYTIANTSYSGAGSAGYGNPKFDDLRMGDTLLVTYLPAGPEISRPGNPRPRLIANLRGAAFVGLVFTLFSYYGLRKRRQEARPPNLWRVAGVTCIVVAVFGGMFCVARGNWQLVCATGAVGLVTVGFYLTRVRPG